MKGRHIGHIALFVVILFGGYGLGQAIYARYLRPAMTPTPGV